MENQNPDNQLQIELKEEVAQGTYANLAIITHSSSEFVLDFVRVLPGLPKAGVQSRVILAPEHAKRLQRALLFEGPGYRIQSYRWNARQTVLKNRTEAQSHQ